MRYFIHTLALVVYPISLNFASLLISPTPVCIGYTPNSILHHSLSKQKPQLAGTLPRYSTCTGVVWSDNDTKVITLNMLGEKVDVYSFDQNELTLNPLISFTHQEGIKLSKPENMALSLDGRWVAISNYYNGHVQFYRTDTTLGLDPTARTTIFGKEPHGVRFSPDGNFFAYTTLGKKSGVYLYSIEKIDDSSLILKKRQVFYSPYKNLRAKSVDFSKDGRFVAIGYCAQLTNKVCDAKGVLATYSLISGLIEQDPLSVVEDLASAESIAFSQDGATILVVDQLQNRITGHDFDKESGQITSSYSAIEGECSQITFPHGIAFSSNGKFLAVTNYGNDSVSIYKLFDAK